MRSLEDAIRYAIERGEFVHLSCVSSGKSFRAAFASASRSGCYSVADASDPVQAMVAAIEAAPMVRKSKDLVPRRADLAHGLPARPIDDPALE